MPTPTVELALAGSFIKEVLAEVNGVYWTMQAAGVPKKIQRVRFGSISAGYPSVYESYFETSITGSVAADLNLATELPEGGYAFRANGASFLFSSHGRPGDFPETARSLEVLLTIASLPGGGIEPAIMGKASFGITYTNAGNIVVYYGGSSTALTYAVSPGALTHIVVTRAGTSPTDTLTLYVNGVNRGTATQAFSSLTSDNQYFGIHWTNAHYLSATYYHAAYYLSALSSGRVTAHYDTLSWTDVTTDTLGGEGLTYERGIRSDSPSQRVASSGVLTFAMNNLASNSGGVTGYYSPGHASCRAGFGKGTPVRVKTGSDTQFIGRLRTIAPVPGLRGNGVVRVVATDFIDRCAVFMMETGAILENVTGDVVCEAIIAGMSSRPHGFEANTGSESYALVLDNTRDEAVSVLSEFHRLAMSELGLIYVRRTGQLVYESRGTRIGAQPTSGVTLADTMHGLDVAEVGSDTINRVQITTHPRLVDTAATTVLFALTNALEIAAGETKTILGPYRISTVPGVTTRVGGLSMVTPAATTDYTMNVLADGTGADVTASLDVIANYGANGVQFVITNATSAPAYVTKLQCRGKGVYDFRTIVVRAENAQAVADDGVNAITIDMVYQQSPNIGKSLADYLLSAYGALAGTRVKRAVMLPDAAGMPAGLLTQDISDRVTVSESITGATGDYYINGVKHEFKNGTLPRVTWWLSPASPQSYWILDLVGASELDSNAILGPG
jgi:hypothetical protein